MLVVDDESDARRLMGEFLEGEGYEVRTAENGRAALTIIERFKPDIVLTWMNRATQMCPKGDFVHVGRLGG